MGFLAGWTYRKKITIAGATGAGTNYQVLLLIGESSGASGYNFHLEGKSANFPSGKDAGGDLRFTASDGTTLLDFWIESVSGTTPNRLAKTWVEVSANLGSNKDIYCYWGNSGASNASNGVNTFLFFDDFSGSSLDTNKWTVLKGTPSVGNGTLTLLNAAIKSNDTFGVSIASRSYLRLPSARGSTDDYGGEHGFSATEGATIRAVIHSYVPTAWYATVDNLAGSSMGVGYDTSFHIHEIKRTSAGSNQFRIDNVGIDKTRSDTLPAYLDGYPNIGLECDWHLIRKFNDTEPTFSSAGALETFNLGAMLLMFLG